MSKRTNNILKALVLCLAPEFTLNRSSMFFYKQTP